jgi:hypothetical protein
MTQVIEGLALLVVLVIIFTQIILPVLAGRPVFPALNTTRSKLAEDIEASRQQAEIDMLEKELAKYKTKRAETKKEKM